MRPLLFLWYINDIPTADDALLYRNINSEKDIIILLEDLNALFLWGKKLQMKF